MNFFKKDYEEMRYDPKSGSTVQTFGRKVDWYLVAGWIAIAIGLAVAMWMAIGLSQVS